MSSRHDTPSRTFAKMPTTVRRGTSTVLFYAFALCAVLLLTAACSREAPKAADKAPVGVTVLNVERKDVPITGIYVAQTQSSQAVNIQARVSGFLDKRMYVEGSVVKTGQVLFQMDQKPLQAQVDAQAAALQRQQAAQAVAKANLDRTKPLTAQNALSQKDLDDATGQFQQASAAVEQAKAQPKSRPPSYTTIRSPVDGVSSYAAVADGTYLSPQNSQLTTVSVLTPMWINFSVSENQMERIRNDVRSGHLKLPEGGSFVVEVEMVDGNLFPYTGRITFADPSYNPTTGTFLLRATVNNPAGVLWPNQYVRVRLKGAIRPNAITIPQRAVQQSAKGHFVWLVNKDNQVEARPIVVGEWIGSDWLIPRASQQRREGRCRRRDPTHLQGAPWTPSPCAPHFRPWPTPESPRTEPRREPAAATPSSVSIYFPSGQATLDTDAQRAMRVAAATYVGIGTQILITGYADKTGNAAVNIALAKRRAMAVRDELVHLGVQPGRIVLTPPASVTGTGGDDQARRVDIAVAK
jgi:membrane fusion protein (multidrug efflux system)